MCHFISNLLASVYKAKRLAQQDGSYDHFRAKEPCHPEAAFQAEGGPRLR